jgi:hypothetical protein
MRTEQLRMSKEGVWSHGTKATRWAIDPSKIMHGWVVTIDGGGILKDVLVPIHDRLPRKFRNKNTHRLIAVTMQTDAHVVTYRTSSMGGLRAVYALIDAIKERITAQKKFCPVVRLRSTRYEHLKYGAIYAPEFEIVGWTGPTGGSEKREPVRPRLAA